MKIKCNVCTDSPVVIAPVEFNEDDILTCPCCDKVLAWAVKPFRQPLKWQPIDTTTKIGNKMAVEVID